MSTAVCSEPGHTIPTHTKTETFVAEFALILGAFALGSSEFVSMGLLPAMVRQTGVSIPEGGHLISAYAIGVVIGVPLIAAAAARASRRALLIMLLTIFALGNAATAAASSYTALVAARFVSGFPHGAYFGVAALIAAHMAHPGKRAQAIGRVMMGLSLANLIGAPVGSWLGAHWGWQTAYGLLAVIGIVTIVLCRCFVPPFPAMPGSHAGHELGALARPQVWLTVAIGAIGLGSLFSVYTYLGSALLDVTRLSGAAIPWALFTIGAGMFAGNFLGGWLADRGVMRALAVLLVANAVVYVAIFFTMQMQSAFFIALFLAGAVSIALVPALQVRLMDVAGHAQSLGAMLNGCAINLANAIGASLGGVAISARLGIASTGLVGAGLSIVGLLILGLAVLADRPR